MKPPHKTDLSTIASATVEADTCRKYVVPICLGGGGNLFCGLKTLAFPARHSLGDGGSLQHSAFDCAFAVLAFSLQPLAFVPRVSDQLCNAVNQLQTLLYAA